MKTTVGPPDELLIEAKKRAAETRTSLREILTRGLRRELALRALENGASEVWTLDGRFVAVPGLQVRRPF